MYDIVRRASARVKGLVSSRSYLRQIFRDLPISEHLLLAELVVLVVQYLALYEHSFEDKGSTYPNLVNKVGRLDATNIFLISSTGICMQLMTSGNSAIMSLLLIVMLATIFFSAVFLAAWPLSFLPLFCNSARSSATFPCYRIISICQQILS